MFNFSKPFSGGVHLNERKELTRHKTIVKTFYPARVYLSLQQRNGVMLKSLFQVGQSVGKGQLIAKGMSDMCVPLHSPVNGVIEAIKPHVTAHPSGMKSETLIIKTSGDTSWYTSTPASDPTQLTQNDMIQRVLDAGVVGLGGAGFPTGIKMRLAKQKGVHTVLINGGECEPYLTCDDRLMQEHASDIVSGVNLMLQAVGAKQAIIAIEDNKPESYSAISSAASELEQIQVQKVPSLYPMGSERHLIKAVTGIALPPGERSATIGILVNNVATARAVYFAIRYQRPLIDRVITVSGDGIETPANLIVPIGTQVTELLGQCGGLTMSAERLIAGGPMMGQVIPSPFAPLDKSIGGIIALTERDLSKIKNDSNNKSSAQGCIRCGRCVQSCPMGLMPFQIMAHSQVSDMETAQDFGLERCLLCGACSYVCPSKIPLVQSFQHARGALNTQRTQLAKSARARELNDARKLRLVKESDAKKAAKAAKSKRKRPTRSKGPVAVEETQV